MRFLQKHRNSLLISNQRLFISLFRQRGNRAGWLVAKSFAMQNQLTSSRPHLTGLLAGLFLASGLALAAFILANTWARLAEASSINVTGSARKDIRSDLAIWRAKFSVDAPTLLEAHE